MDERIRQHIHCCSEAAEYILDRVGQVPDCAVVLGSGLAPFADGGAELTIDYSEIPAFRAATAPGHSGKLVVKRIGGKCVLLLKGRFHCYEGYDVLDTVLPVRALAKMGVKNLILTNAAGGINPDFAEGALMMITDHIGLFAPPVLWGANADEFGVRFPDMTFAYSRKLMEKARKAAVTSGVKLHEGVYAYTKGAQYETPAEIRALKVMGADAVGMSTVPEVVAARHAGMDTLAVSCITNMAAGMTGNALTHEEVVATANRVMGGFIALLTEIITEL